MGRFYSAFFTVAVKHSLNDRQPAYLEYGWYKVHVSNNRQDRNNSWYAHYNDASLGTVDSEKLKRYRAYIVHFVSLLKVLLSILHLNTIIALFFHF